MGEPAWELPQVEMPAWAARTGEVVVGQEGHEGLEVAAREHEEAEHDEHRLELGIDFAHFAATSAEIYEIFTVSGAVLEEHAGLAAAAAEALAPVGSALVIITTARELYKAFDSDARIEAQKGFAYGVMWEVLGVPDVDDPTTNGTLVDVQVPKSDGERRGWEEGVSEGRAIGRRPEVKEAITRALALQMAAQDRDLDTDPRHRAWQRSVEDVLNGVWDKVKEQPENQDRWLNWKGTADGFPQRH